MFQFSILLLLLLVCVSDESPLGKHIHRRHLRKPSLLKEEAVYRLPTNVIPIHYHIIIELDEDVFETNTFSGVSIINITVTEPTNMVTFHAKDMKIENVRVENGSQLQNLSWTSESDRTTDTMTVQTEAELTPGEEYVLIISYTGVLSETALNGFYKSSYEYNGTVHYVASTDFEPTNARKAFPCFDEPAFKATFQITLTFPQSYSALSNTPIVSDRPVQGTNLREVDFATTPIMSTYLIAFAVSEFDCTQDTTSYEVTTEVCSRQDTANMRETALRTAPEVFKIMQNYTHYDYADSNIGKLTQIAIPDYASGAMENWGLVTYRETYLLWDEEESSNEYQQAVVTTVAHELSHQWFGDLVTLNWWSDVFLNEGFATYFEYYASDEIYPEWELPKQFVMQQLQVALDSDSYDWSLPLSYYVEAPTDIDDRFDDISYDKGGSIFRMVRYFLGIENFKAGLIDYITENQFSTATPSILWEAFEKYAQKLTEPQTLPVPMVSIMENWTNKAGYPLLTVTSSGNNVTISQERFLVSGTSDTKWYVPLTWTLSDEPSSDTTTKMWLTPDQDLELAEILANSSWIVLNNQQIGYYRVNYDEVLWQKISEALSEPDFSGIDVINRAQIVDDLFSFVSAGIKNYSTVLDIISFLKTDDEYYPWYAAFRGLSPLLRRVRDESLRASFMGYMSNLMDQLYTSVPFTSEKPENQLYTLKQILTLSWACFLNNEDCVANARNLFANYRKQSIKPSRNLRSIVYCNGLRYSENPSQDFHFLWQKYLETTVPSEQEVILESLGCTTDEELLNLYLEKTVTRGSGIRIQDVYTAWYSVYTGSTTGVNTIFDFIKNNHKNFVDYFGGSDNLNWLIYDVTNLFTTSDQVDNLRIFMESTDLNESTKSFVPVALGNAEANLELTKVLEEELRSYFG